HSPTEETKTDSNVWDDRSEDVNPFGGGNPLLTKETESEPIIWDIWDEEGEYPFVNEYSSFKEEPIMFLEDESCPVYDIDNEEEDVDKDEQTEKLLAMVDQSHNSLMQEVVDQPTKALYNERLLKHLSMDVRASVATCLGEITRITAPYAPYGDEEMKEVFQLVVSSLEDLSDESSRSYPKRVSIVKNIVKVNSCLIVLDLECDDLIVEMFKHFMKSVWNACKPNNDDPKQANHEMDVLAGHENDVNYLQFSGLKLFGSKITAISWKNWTMDMSISLESSSTSNATSTAKRSSTSTDSPYSTRPLIQDVHGNVLDQETQLAPYRRNMQDLLYDSGMISYPEPYQSLYQQRQLGALRYFDEPTLESLNAIDWEPEIEVHSDDNYSEYNVTEECHSAREQGSLSSNASASIECSEEADFMTSSGRLVKRRNLDGEESSLRDDLSGNEQETEAGSEETKVSYENKENGHLKGKAIVSKDLSSHQDNPKKRLVFKLHNRDTSKRESVGPSSLTPPHDIDESSKNFSSINRNGSVKRGGAKSRSIKRPRITEPILSIDKSLDESCPNGSYNIENVVNEKQPIEKEEFSPSDDEIQKGKMVKLNEKQEKNQDKELPIPLKKKYSGIADVKKNNIGEGVILALLNHSSGSDDVFDLSPYSRESKDEENLRMSFSQVGEDDAGALDRNANLVEYLKF
nr:bromodomain and WD repeat-containing protein 3 isoform X1 [Tanacetum cinerariifolium]